MVKVSSQIFDPKKRSCIPVKFFYLFHSTIRPLRRQPSLLWSHAATLKLVLEQAEMRGELASQVRIRALRPEKTP
jgi:hypothetical protein